MAVRPTDTENLSYFEQMFIAGVQVLVLLVCLSFWFVIGFLFWVPLLTRTVAIYCAGMVAAAISQVDLPQLKNFLDNAVEFYPRGFRRMLNQYHLHPSSAASFSASPLDWRRVLWELAWTVMFWSVVYVIVWLLAGGWSLVQSL